MTQYVASPHHTPSGPSDDPHNAEVPKRDIGSGILLQTLAEGIGLNAVHWNIPDGAVVPRHHHEQEQFGYVIRGALEVFVGDEPPFLVRAGDAYLIPPNVPHEFKAVGTTEAIDVFSPPRDLSTAGGQAPAPESGS